jgi:hypothetical protein
MIAAGCSADAMKAATKTTMTNHRMKPGVFFAILTEPFLLPIQRENLLGIIFPFINMAQILQLFIIVGSIPQKGLRKYARLGNYHSPPDLK